MLILARHADESIVLDFSKMTTADLAELIAKPIRITCVGTGPAVAKLGIDAPRSVAVHRLEVAEEIAASGRRQS